MDLNDIYILIYLYLICFKYLKLLNDFDRCNYLQKCSIKNCINKLPKIVIRNLYIYLNYLTQLIDFTEKSNISLYQDKQIKLDISIIYGYYLYEYNKELMKIPNFFPICIKELEKKYRYQCLDFNTIFDGKWKAEGKDIIKHLEKNKIENIKIAFSELLKNAMDSKDYNYFDKIIKARDKFLEDSKKSNIEDLHKNHIENSEFIEKYLNLLTVEAKTDDNPKDDESYKNDVKNFNFYTEILKVDLNNIENVINLIDFYNINEGFRSIFNIDDKFRKYQENIRFIMNERIIDYTNILKQILESEKFYKKLKSILEKDAIKTYLISKRNFSENDYKVKIVDDKEECDDNLKAGYEYLIESLNKDIFFLHKLIIFRYLPKNIRAYVNPYMRMALNPIYINFSDSFKGSDNDEMIKKVILESYLIIILIHEIVHLLKFFNKKSFTQINIPGTPKNKEGGKVFINYLFGIPIINKITFEQAKIIADINNWESIDNLHNIFAKKDEMINNEESKTPDNYFIKYYLSDYEIDAGLDKSFNDPWLDID